MEYAKLPGAGSMRHRAYLSSDHILLVRQARYSESYRRLYLDDIQGVFWAETDDARTFNVGALAGVLSAGTVTFFFTQSPLAASAFGGVLCLLATAGLLIALLISVIRGASVRCWIRTARGQTYLPNVGRLRAARRFAQRIDEAVAMRQGVAEPAQVDELVAELSAPLMGETSAATGPVRAYRFAWIVLLSEAVYAGMTMALPDVFPPGFWILFTVAACGAVLFSLFSGARQTWRFAYRALFTATAYYTTSKMVYWGLYWFLLTTEQIVTFEIYTEDLFLVGGVTVVVNGVLGVIGLTMRAQLPPAPVATPEPAEDVS